MTPIKAYSAFSTTVSSSGDALPDSIQWMPPGKHTINAVKDGEPFEMELEVNETLAQRVAAMLQQYRDKAVRAEGDLPFFDFNHNDSEASAHPLEMYWAGNDPRNGGIRARLQWTGAGADAIQRRTFRRFSPEFLIDENKNVIGVGINMGGLVNRAAFRKIQPIWSRDSGDTTHPHADRTDTSHKTNAPHPNSIRDPQSAICNPPSMDTSQMNLSNLTSVIAQLTETVAAHGSELKTIQAMLAGQPVQPQPGMPAADPKILDLEQQVAAAANASKVAARTQAERAVAAAAVEGKFPPQDQELFKQLIDVFAANPDAGKVILARMPANPALQTVVTNGAPGRGTFGPAEPPTQFAALVKARASELKGDRCRALDAVIIERPDLYKAWREANGQPHL